jgi:cytochrome P450
MYPEPDDFRPERFINPDGTLREDSVLASGFGFGGRICPGKHMAEVMLFIAIASLLSVFDIKGKGTDEGPVEYPFTGGVIKYGYRVSFSSIEGLTSGLVVRVLSPAPLFQGIEERKS